MPTPCRTGDRGGPRSRGRGGGGGVEAGGGKPRGRGSRAPGTELHAHVPADLGPGAAGSLLCNLHSVHSSGPVRTVNRGRDRERGRGEPGPGVTGSRTL